MRNLLLRVENQSDNTRLTVLVQMDDGRRQAVETIQVNREDLVDAMYRHSDAKHFLTTTLLDAKA